MNDRRAVSATGLPGVAASGLIAGALAAAAWAGDPEPCVLPCPEGAIVEVEPCDPGAPDTVNGGCNYGPRTLLVPVVCDSTYCGSVWAQSGTRDLDWFEHSADAMNQVTMTVTANFPARLLHLGVNHACDITAIVDFALTPVCGTASVETTGEVLAGDTSWWIVTTEGFEGVPCTPSADYVVSFTCAPAPPEPCPQAGDADGDGFVDFSDLLVVLANFGPCL